MSPGLSSCLPGSPLLSRSLGWVSPLPGHCRRAASASPGWDSPPRTFAGTGVHQHSCLIRDKTQKLAATTAFGWPLALPGMFREMSPCCQPLSFTQARLHCWCLSIPGVPENTPIFSGGIRTSFACYMIDQVISS